MSTSENVPCTFEDNCPCRYCSGNVVTAVRNPKVEALAVEQRPTFAAPHIAKPAPVRTGVSVDLDVIAWLREQDWSSFAMSLVKQYDKSGRLSEGQMSAAASMKAKCDARKPATATPAAPSEPAWRSLKASPEQLSYAHDLLIERPDFPFEGEPENLTRGKVSDLITALLAVPATRKASEVKVDDIVARFGNPEGRFAFEYEGKMHFFVVDGSLFEQATDNLYPVHGERAEQILTAIVLDPNRSGLRYGIEMETCDKCGRALTSDWRKVGRGPVCSAKAGF